MLNTYDKALAAAADNGTAELERAWRTVPHAYRVTLKAALDRRHKPTAKAADAKSP
jgi:hypothetical protein